MLDRVDEGPRLPFVADKRAEHGGLERVHVHGTLRPDGQGFQQAGQFLRSAQDIPSPFLFDVRPAHEQDFLGCQQGASRRQVARRLREIPFQGVLVRFRLPAPLTERIHVLLGKREGVVRPARVTVHAHEPGQQPREDVGECLGAGAIGLAFVENGVDGKAAVFVLDGARKVRARQFGGKPLQPEAEQPPILPHVIRGSRFAVPGEDRRGEAFAGLHERFGGKDGAGGCGHGVIEQDITAELHGQHGKPGEHEQHQNEHRAPPFVLEEGSPSSAHGTSGGKRGRQTVPAVLPLPCTG